MIEKMVDIFTTNIPVLLITGVLRQDVGEFNSKNKKEQHSLSNREVQRGSNVQWQHRLDVTTASITILGVVTLSIIMNYLKSVEKRINSDGNILTSAVTYINNRHY